MITKQFKKSALVTVVSGIIALSGCNSTSESAPQTVTKTVTAQDAQTFMDNAERDVAKLLIEASQVEWVYQNFITEDTAALAAASGEKFSAKSVALARLQCGAGARPGYGLKIGKSQIRHR